ncbi:MAG: phosphopantetheine-binding protein, partial [SAR324 cluster bacterium]|nr:phosphopantetheine-binding protein [SAR324 cluster bacterium]
QQSVLQVHQQYLQQQGEYSRTVLQLLQQQFQLVSQGQAIPEPVSQSMQWFHAHQGETLRVHEQYLQQQAEQMRAITGTAPVAPVAAPVAISAPQPQLMPVAPVVAPPVMLQPTIPAPQVAAAAAPVTPPVVALATPTPEPAPTAAAAPAASAQDVESMLLSVVAEKTGYPREMLESGMDLEADLGVDSIKRVEILGTLQDQMPELPTIRGEELGELRTLAQITDYLKNQLPEIGAAPAATPTAPASVPATNGSGSSDPAEVLRAVISEKTGYPVEMLEMGMELEADLGVDSIKRVEIMWAIQEKFPELPPINNAEVAELRTLQQITDHLHANLSKTPIGEGETATNGSGEVSSNGHTVFQPDVETLSSSLLAIITEKTGYPTDMLELGMDLEVDLGVDSIKRVEIMWSVQEKFPVLPQLSNSELGELRTLQQIIDRLATELPGLPTAALAESTATAEKKNL